MPLYIHLANLVLQKSEIESKYKGGLSQFIKDSHWGKAEYDSQDDELLLFASMNSDEFDFEFLDKAGFVEIQDYFVITRYSSQENLPDWLQQNGVFMWHCNCLQNQIQLAKKYSETNVDLFFEKKLYLPIHSSSIKNY